MHNHSSVHTQPCTPGCTHALERKGEGEGGGGIPQWCHSCCWLLLPFNYQLIAPKPAICRGSSPAIIWEGSRRGIPEIWKANGALARGRRRKGMLMVISCLSHSRGPSGKTPLAKPTEPRCQKPPRAHGCREQTSPATALGCHQHRGWVQVSLQPPHLVADEA